MGDWCAGNGKKGGKKFFFIDIGCIFDGKEYSFQYNDVQSIESEYYLWEIGVPEME